MARETQILRNIVFSIFNGKSNGVLIECGALNGIYLSVGYELSSLLQWKCFNVEANLKSYQELVKNRPESINLHYALSATDNETVLISNAKKKKLCRIVDDETRQHFKVQTITYKTLITDNKINKVDLLILDIEGYEGFAIRGMQNCEVLPDVICLESRSLNELNNNLNYLECLSESYKVVGKVKHNYFFFKESLDLIFPMKKAMFSLKRD